MLCFSGVDLEVLGSNGDLRAPYRNESLRQVSIIGSRDITHQIAI